MKKSRDKEFLESKIYRKCFTRQCSCGHVVKFKFKDKEKICDCCGKKYLSPRELFKQRLLETIEQLKIKEMLENEIF